MAAPAPLALADTPVLSAALEYAARDWRVLPVRARAKLPAISGWPQQATTDPDVIRKWWAAMPAANVGIVTGPESNLLVLDVDGVPRELLAGRELPPTPTQRTGSGRGWQFFFRWAPALAYVKTTRAGVLPRVDIRGRGGYCVVPPSLHPSGQRYAWAPGLAPEDVELADPPAWLIELLAPAPREPPRAASHAQVGAILEGERNARLTSYAGTMRRRGMAPAAIEAALLAENAANCSPPLPDAEVLGIATSVSRYLPAAVCADPAPLPEDLPAAGGWPDPLSADALHGLAGDVVATIKPHTEADPVALLVQFLIAFGSCVGRGPHYTVEGDEHHANLYAVLVGQTSKARKGTSWGRVRQLFELLDDPWAKHCVHSGLSSGEGVIWTVRDPIPGHRKDTGDPGVADKRLMATESEFANVLRVMTREGNTLSRVIRDGWDRGNLAAMTKNSPAQATGAHLSIVGHITAEELVRYLDRTEAANGFANRFLYLCVRRSRLLPHGGDLDAAALRPLAQRLADAVMAARRVERVRMDTAASTAWERVYGALSAGEPGLLGAVIGRAEAQVVRLATVYALLDGSATLGLAHLRAALALWTYAEQSARHIFCASLGDPIADELSRAITAAGTMTRTQIRDHFARHANAAQINGALERLERLGRVQRSTVETAGRPSEIWSVVATEATEATEGPLPSPSSLLSQAGVRA